MKVLVTGSAGLIGSEIVTFFDSRAQRVIGLDNNMRAHFFGQEGDTRWNVERLRRVARHYRHYDLDIRDRAGLADLFKAEGPFDLIVHCAAQPSHDLAAKRPFEDFDVNAVGTLNLLETTRLHCAEAVFVLMSTNKVYGDAPNELPLKELDRRWDYAKPEDYAGITEQMRIDYSKHSLFGASKVAADVMTQEYGRYFGMKTACFRGGTLTGPGHSAAELHGFLAYVMRCAMERRTYRIFGYKGKMVRDAIHSHDVVSAFEAFFRAPRSAEVYNLGGGRHANTSHLEVFELAKKITGNEIKTTYVDEHRVGDHQWWIGSNARFRAHYPQWQQTYDIPAILTEIYESNIDKWQP